MIRPRLVEITSYKFDFSRERPLNPHDFEEWIELEIDAPSPDGEPGYYAGDEFRACVVSSSRMLRRVESQRTLWGRPYLFVEGWDAGAIQQAVEQIVAKCAAPSYDDVIALLGRFLWVDRLDANPDW